MVTQTITPGDIFLLFYSFPFDFGTDLPLSLGPSVFLNSTPQQILDEANPSALADFVLPGYNLPGTGLVQCCLRKPVSATTPLGITSSTAIFWSIAALRLVAPLGIEIAGQFEVSTNSDKILSPTLYNLRSSWQPPCDRYPSYTGSLVATANRVVYRLLEIRDQKRLFTAFTFFTQVTIGMVSSQQMAVMGLFAALESLFVPKGNHARMLAIRAAKFLASFQFPEDILEWLEHEYIQGRSKLIHGVPDMQPSGKQPKQVSQQNERTGNTTRPVAFGRLHELVRLSILGFLSLPSQTIIEHSAKNGTHLQAVLENLGPAQGQFVSDQAAWCN
jgi:hypothetical protein